MAASRDFNALKGTERIIVYNERRPCYPMGYIPALTPNDDECVRTDCERPFNLADPYLHGGNDSDPIFTTRSGSRGCNQFGDSSPVTPKTAKLIAGASPNCFSPQSGSKGGKGSKKDDCVCQPARKRTKKVKCNTIPPDPRTGAGYPNVKQMAQEIEERVAGTDELGDNERRRAIGGGTWSKLGEDLSYPAQNWQEVERQYITSPTSSDRLVGAYSRDSRPAGGEDIGLTSCRVPKPSSYERFIPSFIPVTRRSGEQGSSDLTVENDLVDKSRDAQDCSWDMPRNVGSTAATRHACQPFSGNAAGSQSGRLLRPKSLMFRPKHSFQLSAENNSALGIDDDDQLFMQSLEKNSSNSKSKTQSGKKKCEQSNGADHLGEGKRQSEGKVKSKQNRSK